MPPTNPLRPVRRASLIPVLALLLCPAAESWSAEVATKVGGDQKRAVEQYLGAVASGSPQAVAMSIHADDIEALRTRVMDMLRAEAKNGDNTIRSRLFGPGLPLAEIERYTAINLYVAIARKLFLTARNYSDASYLAAVPDRDGIVQVVMRGEQPREGGKKRVEVINTVAIKPWGKDWKAAMPTEIEAQIEDLIAGRRTSFAMVPRSPDRNPPPVAVASTNGAAAAPAEPEGGSTLPGIVTLLDGAEKALTEGNCETYYKEHMSPNFRRVTSKKAMEALIASCKNSMATKEMLLTTVRIVKTLPPRFEYQGQRAKYDLAGQGLPYESFALELVNKKWFIAE